MRGRVQLTTLTLFNTIQRKVLAHSSCLSFLDNFAHPPILSQPAEINVQHVEGGLALKGKHGRNKTLRSLGVSDGDHLLGVSNSAQNVRLESNNDMSRGEMANLISQQAQLIEYLQVQGVS